MATEDWAELIRVTETEKWSVARLAREKKARSPNNRPKTPFALEAVRAWIQQPERMEGLEALEDLSRTERVELQRAVDILRMEFEILSYRLRR